MRNSRSGAIGSIVLVIGGVRSGKSRFAQELALNLGGNDVLYVATAEPRDVEMERRIAHHRSSRPSSWQTLEKPLRTGAAIAEMSVIPSVILLDCMTLLVSNVLCDVFAVANSEREVGLVCNEVDDLEARVQEEVDDIIKVADARNTNIIIVSGEVGAGVVPDHAMGRIFRDMLGLANQRIASQANATYWMVAGLPINATALATSVDDAAKNLCQFKTQK